MAQTSDTATEETLGETIGRLRNRDGFQRMDDELRRIREEENRRSGPPADLPKHVRRELEREGLL